MLDGDCKLSDWCVYGRKKGISDMETQKMHMEAMWGKRLHLEVDSHKWRSVEGAATT